MAEQRDERTIAAGESSDRREAGNETVVDPSKTRIDSGVRSAETVVRDTAGGETIRSSEGTPAEPQSSSKTVIRPSGPQGETIVDPGGSSNRTERVLGKGKTFADGRYEVLETVASGGFGTVYRAYDHNFERHVAVKVIKTADIPDQEMPMFLRLFQEEAKAAGKLDHPGIVTVLDHDPYALEPFLVMQFIEGGTLADLLTKREGRKLTWQEAADLGAQIAEALDYAHRNGVEAHRDIKPKNLFCADDGRYKVGDFGIARRQRPQAAQTRSSFVAAGTEGYMSPEQLARPREVDGRSDEFSLAVVLYEALTGKRPFQSVSLNFDPDEDPESARRIVHAAFDQVPKPIAKLAPQTPPALIEIIEKALQIDPQKRYRTCGELARALRAVGGGEKIQSGGEISSLWRAVAALAIVVLLGLGGFLAWPILFPPPPTDVALARQAAIEAGADSHAADTFEEARSSEQKALKLEKAGDIQNAENARQEALSLFRIAEQEAWERKLKPLPEQVAQARARAERAMADTYAAQAFRRAVEAQEAGAAAAAAKDERGNVQARQALASYQAAQAEFAAAEKEAAPEANSALQQKLATLDDRWRESKSDALKMHALATRAAQLDGLLADARSALANSDYAQASATAERAETLGGEIVAAVDAKLGETKLAARSATEAKSAAESKAKRARQMSASTAAADGEFEQGETLLAEARAAEAPEHYAQAEEVFRQASALYERAIGQKQAEFRVAAETGRREAERAREKAGSAGAGSDLQAPANAAYQKASEALERQDYDVAAKEFLLSAEEFAVAERKARLGKEIAIADAAIAQAEAQQKRAAAARASDSPGANRDWQEGERLMQSARAKVEREPQAATADARAAEGKYALAADAAEAYQKRLGGANTAISSASAAEGTADAAGAPKYPGAKEAYARANLALEKAKSLLGSDPSAAEAKAREAERDFAAARTSAEKHAVEVAKAESAIATAAEKREASKAAFANLLDGTAATFRKAEDGLKKAEDLKVADPPAAVQSAGIAAGLFEQAAGLAAPEVEKLRSDVARKSQEVVAAQSSASKAAQNRCAKEVFAAGERLLAQAKSTAGDDPPALKKQRDAYTGAIAKYAAAKKLAESPPVTASPPPGQHLTVVAGAKSGVKLSLGGGVSGASVQWSGPGARGSSGTSFEYRPPFEAQSGTVTITAKVDRDGCPEEFTWPVRVDATNAPPRISSFSPDQKVFTVGESVGFRAAVSDADEARGDAVTCEWRVNGAPRGSGACNLDLPALAKGDYRVDLVAVDRKQQRDERSHTFRVEAPNAEPLVQAWVKQHCRTTEENYLKVNGKPTTVRAEGIEIDGDLPTVTVRFRRIDSNDEATKTLDKNVTLRCAAGRCAEVKAGS